MAEWLTVEVFDAEGFPASRWQDAHGNDLIESAITNYAVYWEWHATRWGVVLELAFGDDERLERYRRLPAVQAALDAVPDLAHGLVVYRGRGGGAGVRVPRRPRPRPVAAGAEWPPPDPEVALHLAGALVDMSPDVDTPPCRQGAGQAAVPSRRSRAAESTAGASASAMRA